MVACLGVECLSFGIVLRVVEFVAQCIFFDALKYCHVGRAPDDTVVHISCNMIPCPYGIAVSAIAHCTDILTSPWFDYRAPGGVGEDFLNRELKE
ncbi:hypothetical protein BFJ69_g17179 [Fusarium oxysporum]|uniref:Uncharacterized protein n=1 Tax=Fusarium oxysporum TaxID=5507 RepID=A0A420M911_FUSOX|nr:hypothetical protein BFJ69_g17179 [Fusarium oxysporum]